MDRGDHEQRVVFRSFDDLVFRDIGESDAGNLLALRHDGRPVGPPNEVKSPDERGRLAGSRACVDKKTPPRLKEFFGPLRSSFYRMRSQPNEALLNIEGNAPARRVDKVEREIDFS